MPFLQMNFKSEALHQNTTINVLLPSDAEGKFKTLWLLHGLNGDHTDWMRMTSVQRYARKYKLAVVMPCVDRSWYTDTAYGKNYFTYITKELPSVCEKYFGGYSRKQEDNLIIGLSMGGYGALKCALTYPEQYSFCASLLGSLDITRKGRKYNIDEWRSNFGFDLQSPLELEGSKHDLFALAKEKKDFPPIYMWCGTEDSLIINVNHQFAAHLRALQIDHTFIASEGDHSWKWWDLHLQNALEFWNKNINK